MPSNRESDRKYISEFYASLSKIHLTKLALGEFDQRKGIFEQLSILIYYTHDGADRIIKNALAGLKKNSNPVLSAIKHLHRFRTKCLKKEKVTSNRGIT